MFLVKFCISDFNSIFHFLSLWFQTELHYVILGKITNYNYIYISQPLAKCKQVILNASGCSNLVIGGSYSKVITVGYTKLQRTYITSGLNQVLKCIILNFLPCSILQFDWYFLKQQYKIIFHSCFIAV